MVIRWGIVGAGGIANRRTIPEMLTVADNSTLIAVMGISPDGAAKLRERYSILLYYQDLIDLLENPDIDAVYVASPNFAHCEQVIAAANHGKHVLCEKPLAGTVSDGHKMVDACEKAGVKLGVNFCMRLNPYNQKAKELVKEGALGRIVLCRAQLTTWYPPIQNAWRQNPTLGYGGSLIDMGSHCIDLLEYILDAEVTSVSGFTSSHIHDYEPEDTAAALLEFSNGAIGMVDTSFAIPDHASRNMLEIYGTQGSIIAHGTIGQTASGSMATTQNPESEAYSALQANRGLNDNYAKISNLVGAPLYGEMIRLFSEAIVEQQPFFVDGITGIHNIKVVNAIYESSRRKKRISI